MLWGRSAGRCQFDGCNKPLTYHPETKDPVNIADVSHIIGFSDDGPRGEEELSEELARDITNLMLLCKTCHRTVDTDRIKYSVDLLRQMKRVHETRVEIATNIGIDKQSHVLLYGANIGNHTSPVSFDRATIAMFPSRYPADTTPISLGLINSSLDDRNRTFWELESSNLRTIFDQRVKPRLASGDITHLSVIAIAPQPLLMLLGFLLSDIPAVDVYQLHREPPDWRWQEHPIGFKYIIEKPSKITKTPALVFSLSATINSERVERILGKDVSIWKFTIEKPNNDFLKSEQQLSMFRQQIRILLDRIKSIHGDDCSLNVFPSMPVATAVEFGRVIMPKADLPIILYDENHALGGFQLTTIRLAI